MITLKVDFNTRGRGGRVRTSQRRAPRPLGVGERVIVEDPDEGMSFEATVAEIDAATGRVYLDVDWERSGPPSVSAGSGTGTTFTTSIHGWGADHVGASSAIGWGSSSAFRLAVHAGPQQVTPRREPEAIVRGQLERVSA